MKEIDSLNHTKIPDRKILVLLAEQEQITDNNAAKKLIERFDFIDLITIKESQHEILIEKEKIRKQRSRSSAKRTNSVEKGIDAITKIALMEAKELVKIKRLREKRLQLKKLLARRVK